MLAQRYLNKTSMQDKQQQWHHARKVATQTNTRSNILAKKRI